MPSSYRVAPSPIARLHCGVGSFFAWWGWQWGAIQAYRDALRLDPDNAQAHFRAGEALARSRRWHEASAAFHQAVRLDPTNPDAHGNLVLCLAQAGLGDQAVQVMQRLIRLRPHEAELYVLLGALLRRERRHEEAIRSFRWAVRLAPAPAWRRFFLGEAVLGPLEWRKTLEWYDFARSLEPAGAKCEAPPWRSCLNHHPGTPMLAPFPPARRVAAAPRARPRRSPVGIGDVFRAACGAAQTRVGSLLSGRRRGVAPGLARGGLIAPARGPIRARSPRARMAWTLAPLLLGPAVAQGSDDLPVREQFRLCVELPRKEGVEACRKALEMGQPPPRAVIAHLVLALDLAGLERWDEAVEVYRGLVALQPRDAEAHQRLGVLLLHGQNRPEEAVALLAEALHLRPDPRAHGALATALNLLGRFEESIIEFEHALALSPTYFEYRPAERLVFEASRRGESWPPR